MSLTDDSHKDDEYDVGESAEKHVSKINYKKLKQYIHRSPPR
jgi:hypothetical protein